MHYINCKDGKQLLYIDQKSYHFSGNLVDISKFDQSDLKLDKKGGKILIFITLIIEVVVLTMLGPYIC